MLYLAIDQHRKQLTINLRDEAGDVLLRKQVSTEWTKVRQFLDEVRARAEPEGGYLVILEVCGFNAWLLQLLTEKGCRETILVQPEGRAKQKTDRKDASALADLLWVNRQRFLAGKPVQGVRRVRLPNKQDAEARQLTCLWNRLTSQRTRTINRIRHLVNKHNLYHDMPTKGIQTKACLRWLKELKLPTVDRLEMDFLLASWSGVNEQLAKLEVELQRAAEAHELAKLWGSVPGMGTFNSLALACRVSDDLSRFTRGQSLSNYWGVAPGCRNSGEATQRLGSITKVGSRLARLVLGQLVFHVIRKDPWMRDWYRAIKLRRGGKIAYVAVMRKLTVVLWTIARTKVPYIPGGPHNVARYRSFYQDLKERAARDEPAEPTKPADTPKRKRAAKKKAPPEIEVPAADGR